MPQKLNNYPQKYVDKNNAGGLRESQNRFESYTHTDKAYKYNMFSAVDEPWNNFVRGNKCGSFPRN